MVDFVCVFVVYSVWMYLQMDLWIIPEFSVLFCVCFQLFSIVFVHKMSSVECHSAVPADRSPPQENFAPSALKLNDCRRGDDVSSLVRTGH